ncbi:MAG: c-type cytochrome [Nitrospinae bacterium]|nr:c-type cytochrome [Nitrospinota bacterium]
MTTAQATKRTMGAALLLAVSLALALVPTAAEAAPGDTANGKVLYEKKCWWCHGKTGEADGPAANFVIPPPRDFSLGVYKYKGSEPKAEVVRDEDLFRMISDGMPGTSMPAWKSVLSDKDRWDLVAYIKTLTDMFEGTPNPAPIDLSGKIASSEESISLGAKAYEAAKCFECHGVRGKGDTIKKLKEDSGKRVWPRNLTKQWTFRAGSTVEDIYTRVTNGIPNTPMPSFYSEKTGEGKLSTEDRWHVANYIKSLEETQKAPKDGETVVKGMYVAELPKSEKDEIWNEATGVAFNLVPQIIAKERFFIPANDLIYVKAMFNEKEVAFLLEWDDRSKSVPGDPVAEGIAWDTLTPDGVAVQTSVVIPTAGEKPYFGHGDASHTVSMLYWTAGSVETGPKEMIMSANGIAAREPGDAKAAGFTTSASYEMGTWKVMMKRSLATANKEKETQFEAGRYIPIAFANWDGSNGESGSKHTMTTWVWLLLKPDTGSEVVVIPGVILILLVGGQLAMAALLRKKKS